MLFMSTSTGTTLDYFKLIGFCLTAGIKQSVKSFTTSTNWFLGVVGTVIQSRDSNEFIAFRTMESGTGYTPKMPINRFPRIVL